MICIFAFLLSHQIPLSRDIKMEDVWCMKILKKSHLTTLRVASYFTLKYDFCPKNWILPKLENETFWPFSNTMQSSSCYLMHATSAPQPQYQYASALYALIWSPYPSILVKIGSTKGSNSKQTWSQKSIIEASVSYFAGKSCNLLNNTYSSQDLVWKAGIITRVVVL